MNNSEENITVDCEMKTMTINDFENPSLAEECNLNKIVINASIFVELLQRLDSPGDDLRILFSPDYPHFTLKSTSLNVSVVEFQYRKLNKFYRESQK